MPAGVGADADRAQPPLNVRADLRIDVDGAPAHLRGSGRRLELYVPDPLAVMAGVPGGGLASVQTVARMLDQAGLRVDVVSDRGRLISVGAGVESRLARWGAPRNVTVGSLSALGFLVRAAIGRRPRRAVTVLGALGLALGVTGLRAARSRSAR